MAPRIRKIAKSNYQRRRNKSRLTEIVTSRRQGDQKTVTPLLSPKITIPNASTKQSKSGRSASNTLSRFEHARVQVRRTRYRSRFVLSRIKHCPSELASQLINHLTQKAEALDFDPGRQFHKWANGLASKLHFAQFSRPRTPPSRAFIQQGIKIISDIFFFGALDHCQFRWKQNMFNKNDAYGITWPCPTGTKKYWTHIGLDPADLHHNSGTKDRKTCIIGTLLHECIHAFLATYVCNVSQSNEEWKGVCLSANCRATFDRIWGVDGHGVAWLQVATHVEALARRRLGVSIDLDVGNAVKRNFVEDGFILTADEIQSCHRDSQRMLRDIMDRADAVRVKTHTQLYWFIRRRRCSTPFRMDYAKNFRRKAFSDRLWDKPVGKIAFWGSYPAEGW